MRKTFIVSLMILLGLSQTSAAQAANTDLLANGMQLYQFHQYMGAYNEFNMLAQRDSKNPAAHYLLAITMVQMHDIRGAVREYQRALSLDPHGKYGQQAMMGLQALASPPPGTIYNPAFSVPAPANGNISTVADAMSAIKQQADIADQVKRSDVQSTVHDINETAAGHASKLAKKRDDVAEMMASASVVTPHGHLVPAYSDADIAAVQQRFNDKIANVQQQGATDAEQAQVIGSQTVNALNNSANNLYSQLQNPNPNGVHLVPQGTNLYVRNYSSN